MIFKWKWYWLSIFVGLTIAFMTYCHTIRKLLLFEGAFYSKLDFFNIALLTTEFNKYDYLTRHDITLGFSPFLFFLFGTFLISAEFLLMPKSYQCFLFSRFQKQVKVMKMIKGPLWVKNMLFTSSFMLSLYLLASFKLPLTFNQAMPLTEKKLLLLLGLHTGVKFLTLQLLCHIVFLCYRLKDTAFAFLGGISLIFLLYLMDTHWKGMNLISFYSGNYFIESFVILGILSFFSCYCSLRLKLDHLN